ncbi:MAG TPA: M81 family metallopeptidase [Bryobacteraceae bacterium]|nr:M81 family metallopeptidase [Bryobacteraceae bacterium]
MSIAIASILQESNTFSPVMTRYEDFSPVFGPAVLERHRGKMTEMGGFLSVLAKSRKEVAPVCAAWAITANRLMRPDFKRLIDEFASHLETIRQPEGLLLAMHGAQTAEGEDDVEGHVLGRAREIFGPEIPIVMTLDLHANVTHKMIERATAIIGYHTYPHIDMYETGQKAARLLLKTLAHQIRPVMAWRKLPLIVNAENQQTSHGPARRLWVRAEALERAGKAEAVSIFPVQAWMDIKEMGSAVVVVSNGDARAADRHAAALSQKFWDTRREFEVTLTPVEEAIRLALATDGGPVVLAESSDSTGSGSPGDSTGVLRYLVKAALTEPAAIFLVDPEAVAMLASAGVGSTVTLPIGGKLDRHHSKPVQVTGHVRIISDGRWTARARGYNTGIETSMGKSVVFEVGFVRILIAERPAMTVDPELFRSHGIEPLHSKIVVVKSPNGFRAAYEPIAKRILVVDTPGVSTAKLETLPWRRIDRPIYPLDRNVKYKA